MNKQQCPCYARRFLNVVPNQTQFDLDWIEYTFRVLLSAMYLAINWDGKCFVSPTNCGGRPIDKN